MEFKILGKTSLLAGDDSVYLGTAKQRGVLALLLHDVGRPVPIDLIISELWRGETLESSKRRFHPIISRLRKVLSESGSGGVLRKEGAAYRLELDPLLVDLHRFRHLVTKARQVSANGDHFMAKTLAEEALALWQGKPLDDLGGIWADHCRAQMEQFDRLPAYYLLFDSQLQLGEYSEVMSAVGRLVDEHDTEEMFARHYMRSLDGMGKYSRALEFYTEFCARLEYMIGAEPGPEMRALYQAVLQKQAGTAIVSKIEPEPPQQLERDIHNFVGRKELLVRLDALLTTAQGQVVALHGMPAAGKTSLATRWAHQRKSRFPDGQLFVNLCGHGPTAPMAPDDAIAILLASLGVPVDRLTVDERRVRLRRSLSGKRILLILDNARDGGQVRPILTATADCCCLVTSRTELKGLTIRDGVRTLEVPPLRPDESTGLLLAELDGKGRSGEDEGLAALVGLAEGLPLCLRIIAQHAVDRPYTSLLDLAHELRQREGLGLLDSADSDDEYTTLSTAFSWSYRALPAAVALSFRRLGLHPGPQFDISAACAVLGEDEPVVVEHLRMLVKANLVRQISAARYRLHDLLYGYAVDLVRHEEVPEQRELVLRRLFDWYLASTWNAAQRVTPERTRVPMLDGISWQGAAEFETARAALDWFAREQTNLAAAVSHATRHGLHDHAWQMAANMNEAFDRFGFYTDLRLSHEIALSSAREVGHKEGECGTLNNLGVVLYRLGRYDEAREALSAAAALADELGHRELRAVSRYNLATVHFKIGQSRIAIVIYEKVLDLLRGTGARSLEACALDQLANVHHKMELDDVALDYHEQALVIREEVGDVRGQGTTFTELAKIHHEHGESDKALKCGERALEAHLRSGDKAGMGEAFLVMSETLYDLGSFVQSADAAEKATRLCRHPNAQARAFHVLGHVRAVSDDLVSAEGCWSQAVELLLSAPDHGDDHLLAHLRGHGEARRSIPDPRAEDAITLRESDLPVSNRPDGGSSVE
ncbi:AfsR/SARP family transcriptional regulator [Lentzea flaviverrucosa]|uniref:DNA-binding transcriptional activator of the SARP family n=1 Tax=Lentzea flaviverrucosa TaxID=200379 RepID=A0A1H9RS28_9PSEU|nr:BTAD domain-containing putative transcriptional regulator [Lentzea flaviverrucosa]RDI33096.1 DNA-binding SARP family transcriptional activator [Lentzea flaviverrucosa]SER74709.1 DNA-binding transcriptional activator of the SARP family [Lentzea flaviverrucosa]